jgi:uncharacterized protein
MNYSSMLRTILMLAALVVTAAVAPAQDLGAVRARMAERLPQIDSMKAAGAIGEDNQGFVAVREARDNAGALVSAENADRRVVYDSIAKQTGAPAETVGRQRAQQIAAQSAAGVWLQRPDGNWYRK